MASTHLPVRWVASDPDGLPMKRKQVVQACELCRKRKKRCRHTGPPDTAQANGKPRHDGAEKRRARQQRPGPDSSSNTQSRQNNHADDPRDEDATQVAANRLIELSASRFVGDLNPEGIFIQAASTTLPVTPSTYRDSNDLGVWFPPSSQQQAEGEPDTESQKAAPQPPAGGKKGKPLSGMAKRRNGGAKSSFAEASYLYEQCKNAYVKECLSVLPERDDYIALHKIYCEKVHPLFPVLNDAEVDLDVVMASQTPAPASPTLPSSSPRLPSIFSIVAKQIICLAAATTDSPASAPHLRLEPSGPLLTSRQFHRRLADAVASVLELSMISPRFDHVRALILLSFFYQPAGEADRHKPALFCSHAIHHFQTIGAHLHGYRPQRPEDDVDRIFCCIYALDRLCAILYARSLILHMQDSGKTIETCTNKQPPCFRLFMLIIQWVDRIILLYRPRQPFVLIDIPVFESLILDAGAEKLPAMHLGTIEVLYHTVCVLSCRQPGSAFSDTPSAEDRKHLPLSIINPRRSHSADRIAWVAQTQPICLLPFVPYAVSLALSVQYKKMRYSRTPMYRTRSRAVFKDIVALLKDMGDVFLSVRVNAALGESIWRQMEKTANTLAREEMETQKGTQQEKVPAQDISSESSVPVQPALDQVEAGNQLAMTMAMEASDGQVGQQDFRPLQPPQPLLDLSMLDNLDTDVDLFGNFDPSFDLGAVDTALEANLDMGIPQNWTPWGHIGG